MMAVNWRLCVALVVYREDESADALDDVGTVV